MRFESVAGEYKDLFDNRLVSSAEVTGIADNKAIKEALNALTAGLVDWAHNKMHEATDTLFVGQTVCLLVTRLGGQLKSTDKAVTIDLATKSQLEQAKTNDASSFYGKLKQDTPMYVGMAISDAYLTSLVSDLSKQIEDVNIVDILKMIPQADKVTEMMTIDKVA